MELEGYLFGPFTILLDGRAVTSFRSIKAQALLAYLLTEKAFLGRPTPHQRGTLMTLCWPNLPTKYAQANLRQTIYRLRTIISTVKANDPYATADEPFFLVDRLQIAINPAAVYGLDLEAFLKLDQEVRRHKHHDLFTCSYCYSRLKEAAALYKGDFLVDLVVPDCFDFEEWAAFKRERLRQIALSFMQKLAFIQLATGRYIAAAETAWRQLEIDNLNEFACQQSIEALVSIGRMGEALSQYDRFCSVMEMNGMHVSPALVKLAGEIRAGVFDQRSQQQPAIQLGNETLHLLPGNVMRPLFPLIGRRDEVRDLQRWLVDGEGGIVTIHGTGGAGKTTLAQELAWMICSDSGCSHRYPDGIFFLTLDRTKVNMKLRDHIERLLRLELGFTPQSNLEPDQTLLQLVRGKRFLLVLDNFASYFDELPLIRELLSAAPRSCFLLTTCALPGIEVGQVYPIFGLVNAAAQGGGNKNPEESSAVRLFTSFARRYQPAFLLDSHNRDLVAKISQYVDGLPVGIELAASWVHVLPLEIIANYIRRNPDALANPNVQNGWKPLKLRRIFDRLWDRLEDAEQDVLCSLPKSKQELTGEWARHYFGDEDNRSCTLITLKRLIDKSFLYYRPEADHYHAYRLWQPYIREKLEPRREIIGNDTRM